MHTAVQVCDLSVLSTYASSVQVVPAILEPADAPGPSALSVSHSVLTIGQDRKTIYCPESDLSKIQSFEFDHIYDLPTVTDCSCFAGSGAHLVDAVLRGDNASLIVSGESPVATSISAEGRAAGKPSGMIEQSAAALFQGMRAAALFKGQGPTGGQTRSPSKHAAVQHSAFSQVRGPVTHGRNH
jgi:hypothetical protein